MVPSLRSPLRVAVTWRLHRIPRSAVCPRQRCVSPLAVSTAPLSAGAVVRLAGVGRAAARGEGGSGGGGAASEFRLRYRDGAVIALLEQQAVVLDRGSTALELAAADATGQQPPHVPAVRLQPQQPTPSRPLWTRPSCRCFPSPAKTSDRSHSCCSRAQRHARATAAQPCYGTKVRRANSNPNPNRNPNPNLKTLTLTLILTLTLTLTLNLTL